MKKVNIYYRIQEEELPMPLKRDEEQKVLHMLHTDQVKQGQMLLIEHNLRLVLFTAKKYRGRGVGVDELFSIGALGLIKAIRRFDGTIKCKFSTYALQCINNEIRMQLRKYQRIDNEISLDEPISYDQSGNELCLSELIEVGEDEWMEGFEKKWNRRLFLRAFSRLPQREQTVIALRFGLNTTYEKQKTQKEVAACMGMSQPQVSRIEKKGIDWLKKEVKKISQAVDTELPDEYYL